MAKTQKLNADWFAFNAIRGKKWRIVQQEFGNDGIVLWIVLLQELADADHHHFFGSPVILTEIGKAAKVNYNTVVRFIEFFIENFPDHFNGDLWSNHKVLRNDKLIDNLTVLWDRRVIKTPMGVDEIKKKYKKIEVKERIEKESVLDSIVLKDSIHDVDIMTTECQHDVDIMFTDCVSEQIKGIQEEKINEGYYNLTEFFNIFKRNVIYSSLEDQNDFNQITTNFFKEDYTLQKKVYIHLKSKLGKSNDINEIRFLQLNPVLEPTN